MSLQRLLHRRQRISFADYGFEVRQFDLPREGLVEYAQWLHPYDMPKRISQQAVDSLRVLISPGDFVIDARGRTYFSNQAMLTRLRIASQPAFTVSAASTS